MNFKSGRPLVMHIDLNSCFATIEQQSRPRLRGRAVAVVNRAVENTSIVTASYEAKRCGLKTGMKLRDAKRLVPQLVALESDPPKYTYVYRKLLAILERYSANVEMKSIDEGVIDFAQAAISTKSRDLLEVGAEIKRALQDEVGSYMMCNIGIGPNRWWAKVAAGLDKPNGMTLVDADNFHDILARLGLRDLTGIAGAYEARLRAVSIDTPQQLYEADLATLERLVWKSIDGAKWYKRLRGYEVDNSPRETKQIGRQYVLEDRTMSREQILAKLHTLSESVGQRMRAKNYSARGVYVYARSRDGSGIRWHNSRLHPFPIFSNAAIFATVRELFTTAPGPIHEIGMHVYKLTPAVDKQLTIFADELARTQAVTHAIDDINAEWGERTIRAASTLGADVSAKIPFGSTRHL